MTKETLAEALRQKFNSSKKVARETVAYVFDAIVSALKRGEEVTITGFGSFRVGKRRARTGVNPRTGEKISIPAMNVPKFRPAKGLKDAVK
jgi:DNA-binding protein HU-beta